MFRILAVLVLAPVIGGCVVAPPYGDAYPPDGPGYYAPGPTIGVGVGGGSFGGGVGVGVGVGF